MASNNEDSPRELILDTKNNFSVADDLAALKRITVSVNGIRQTRQQRRADSQRIVTNLARQVEQSQGRVAALQAHRDADHGLRMNTLDRDKFTLAKTINALESNAHTLGSRLALLQETLAGLNEDVMQEPNALAHEQGAALKLSVYRDLGIRLVDDGTGGYAQAVVKSGGGNKAKEVHFLQMSQQPGSYADHLWTLCSE